MLGRRLLLLVAVLMGLTALAASVAPRQQSGSGTAAVTPTRTPTPASTAAGEPEAGPASGGRVVELTVSAAPGAPPARLEARVGDTVRLEVSGDVLDAVEIQGGLGLVDGITPEAPARFELLAERAGRYPIVLDETERRLGELEIVSDR